MGRFTKRLRFLDYLIILAILLAGVVLFKFFNPQEQWIEVEVSARNIPYFQANAFDIGDLEKDSSGKKIAEIVDVQTYQVYDTYQIGSRDIPNTNRDIFVRARILVKVNPRSGEFEYKNKIVKVGSPIELRFTKGLLSGRLTEFGDSGKEEIKSKLITFVLYDHWPWFADSIKIGEGEPGRNGQKSIEVVSKEVKPAEITVTTAGGETRRQIDPRKVDIRLKVKMEVQLVRGEIIFREVKQILVGETLSFNAGKTRIQDAYIEKIEDMEL